MPTSKGQMLKKDFHYTRRRQFKGNTYNMFKSFMFKSLGGILELENGSDINDSSGISGVTIQRAFCTPFGFANG
jgi:hypothetical protein